MRAGAIVVVAVGIIAGWEAVQPTVGRITSRAFSPSGHVTYYVRPGGSDVDAGTSPTSAWRTLARASRAVLRPGDRLLLLGGHTYPGPLTLGAADAGDVRSPVTIGSYGKGRATIRSRTNGIMVLDTGGLTIRDLIIRGHDARRPSYAGIQLYSDRTRHRLGHIFISKADISGFGFGIAIGAAHDGAGFRNVRVTRSAVHGNLDGGLVSYGPNFNPAAPGYAHEGIYISRVRAFRNPGDPANTTRNTGSGIELGSVRGATITQSQAYANGGAGGTITEGPIGFWAYDSTDVVMEHDVSHDNRSSNVHDGGGFGLDKYTSDSVLEYDLSYRNHGAGFLLYTAMSYPQPQTGNVVRFNISYGDARETRHVIGGMAAAGRVANADFYQNTVVMTGSSHQPAFKATGEQTGVRVLNNILIAAQGPVVAAVQPKTLRQVLFAGNDYRSSAGLWDVQWGVSANFLSLPSWRAATGEEMLHGRATGRVRAPMFAGPLTGVSRLAGPAFQLRPGAPLANTGLNLVRRFGIRPGPVTFGGQPYRADRPDVGAQ